MNPGKLIKEARRKRGLSQNQLALRAGTRQSAISRLESGEVSPTVATLTSLLRVMGEDLTLTTRPPARRYDTLHRRSMERLTPEQRLALAISWNRMAGEFAAAGRKARGE
ncbi:MAG: helix-turn-helix domain-containing protein [Solirubrobacterales bacterium]|nr:helix-turn-helix domain-containing protein [Solirubrobacterales bacterium]